MLSAAIALLESSLAYRFFFTSADGSMLIPVLELTPANSTDEVAITDTRFGSDNFVILFYQQFYFCFASQHIGSSRWSDFICNRNDFWDETINVRNSKFILERMSLPSPLHELSAIVFASLAWIWRPFSLGYSPNVIFAVFDWFGHQSWCRRQFVHNLALLYGHQSHRLYTLSPLFEAVVGDV